MRYNSRFVAVNKRYVELFINSRLRPAVLDVFDPATNGEAAIALSELYELYKAFVSATNEFATPLKPKAFSAILGRMEHKIITRGRNKKKYLVGYRLISE